ncbi:MAG: hypothetical protein RLZZ435_1292 [Cyanobacteriota bacterium]|jgi:hypothetical protein
MGQGIEDLLFERGTAAATLRGPNFPNKVLLGDVINARWNALEGRTGVLQISS